MRVSFATKLALTLSAVALLVAGGSLMYFYHSTRSMLLNQMGDRLKDIGRTALHQFGGEERAALGRVRAKLDAFAEHRALITGLVDEGEYAPALPDAVSSELMMGEDFRTLVQFLRRIKMSTMRRAASGAQESSTIAFATILTPIRESPERTVLQFLADADFDTPGKENPVGTLFRNNSAAIRNALLGEVSADKDFRREHGQHLLSGAIPLFDEHRRVIGVLALDYDAASEVNDVERLYRLSLYTAGTSALLALLLAIAFGRVLNKRLDALCTAARRVAARDFSVVVES